MTKEKISIIIKLNQKEYKLPLVITIVLYTGNKRWDAKKYVRDKQEKLEGYDENKVILILIINLLLRKKIGEKKSNELVEILKGDDENMLAVLDMIEKDNKRIFRKGKKEGKKENQIRIAKKLLQMKMPLKQIIEITELSNKDIENLK